MSTNKTIGRPGMTTKFYSSPLARISILMAIIIDSIKTINFILCDFANEPMHILPKHSNFTGASCWTALV